MDNVTVNETFDPFLGVPEIVDATFLSVCSVLGTFGNLLVIFSIIYEGKVFANGNLFMINLAVSDLIVCCFSIPVVVANIIKMENVLSKTACSISGYMLSVSCSCSICNLVFIAFCRYWYVTRNSTYNKAFSNLNVLVMVFVTWIYANIFASPALFGWSKLIYDKKLVICIFDDHSSATYNITLMTWVFFVPAAIILFCYWKLFRFVRKHHSNMRQLPICNDTTHNCALIKREMNLLKTLAMTVFMFLLCWTPYTVMVMCFPTTVPFQIKRVAGRLGLSNSAMNFIVYGVMNPGYRKGYKELLFHLFYCKRYASSTSQAQ